MTLSNPHFETSDRASTPIRSETRLLILDNDSSFVLLCESLLLSDGDFNHTIVPASSFLEAKAIEHLEQFDCFLIDYYLPDKVGTDAINDFRQLLVGNMPPTIVVAADGGEEAAVEAVRAGAADFLVKRNINQESLRRAVRNAVQKGMLQRSLFQRVNELEVANELLKKRNTEIQRFYHTVSHEVKTPLTAIQEFVSIVHDGIAGEIDEEQKTILQYALDSCDQISSHFNDLLELSRFETGKMKVNMEPKSIQSVLQHCVVAANPAAQAKGISLVFEKNTDLPLVMIETNRIIQVVSNLVGNAIKFTNEGGEVRVICELIEGGESLQISVKDTGCGISSDHINKIFDRLYQITPASNDKDEKGVGMGLGLAISSEIVHLHGGRIGVESTPGVGSVFSFSLKVHHAEENTVIQSQVA